MHQQIACFIIQPLQTDALRKQPNASVQPVV